VLESHGGQQFDAIVSGCSHAGAWARIFAPPTEDRMLAGEHGLEVGRQVRVKLVLTDVERGFIDFVRVN
jgi:exoribonuclease-2